MKKRNNQGKNKGFSLVELIVVVAIMAVLTAVLAPQYIKYVESSRIKKDEAACEEIRHAVEIAIADEAIYDKLFLTAANDTTLKVVDQANATSDSVFTTTNYTLEPGEGESDNSLITAVQEVVGAKIDFSSKAYDGKTLTVTIDHSTLDVSADKPA